MALLLLLSACSTTEERPRAFMWTRTEFFMRAVPEAEWEAFMGEVVTPKFPVASSVIESHREWRGPDGNIQKLPSRVLVILHPASYESDAALEEVRREFKARFQEQPVRIDSPAVVSF